MPELISTDRPTLTRQLRRMALELARLRDAEVLPDGADSPPSRWEDEDYIYLEVELSAGADLEADISLWAGRALIRIAR
jgi:hypothetical protein